MKKTNQMLSKRTKAADVHPQNLTNNHILWNGTMKTNQLLSFNYLGKP